MITSLRRAFCFTSRKGEMLTTGSTPDLTVTATVELIITPPEALVALSLNVYEPGESAPTGSSLPITHWHDVTCGSNIMHAAGGGGGEIDGSSTISVPDDGTATSQFQKNRRSAVGSSGSNVVEHASITSVSSSPTARSPPMMLLRSGSSTKPTSSDAAPQMSGEAAIHPSTLSVYLSPGSSWLPESSRSRFPALSPKTNEVLTSSLPTAVGRRLVLVCAQLNTIAVALSPLVKQDASVAFACMTTELDERKMNKGGASIDIVGIGSESRRTFISYPALSCPRKLLTISKKT